MAMILAYPIIVATKTHLVDRYSHKERIELAGAANKEAGREAIRPYLVAKWAPDSRKLESFRLRPAPARPDHDPRQPPCLGRPNRSASTLGMAGWRLHCSRFPGAFRNRRASGGFWRRGFFRARGRPIFHIEMSVFFIRAAAACTRQVQKPTTGRQENLENAVFCMGGHGFGVGAQSPDSGVWNKGKCITAAAAQPRRAGALGYNRPPSSLAIRM